MADRFAQFSLRHEIVNSPGAAFPDIVIIDHDDAPRCDLVEKTGQAAHGGLIPIAIEPKNGDWFLGLEVRKRLIEPTFDQVNIGCAGQAHGLRSSVHFGAAVVVEGVGLFAFAPGFCFFPVEFLGAGRPSKLSKR